MRGVGGSERRGRGGLSLGPSPKGGAEVTGAAMGCRGAALCPSGEAGFARMARERAEQAEVVGANTRLSGTHLASGGHVLPEHDVVVFDEAHALDRIATGALGSELSAGGLRNLAASLRRLDAPAASGAALAASASRVGDARERPPGRVRPPAPQGL